MADTKMDEAIALARRIVAMPPPNNMLAAEHNQRTLARALIDATSPGAQYRAGMESAAEIGAGSVGQVADTSANAAERIRAAISDLPAKDPDHG